MKKLLLVLAVLFTSCNSLQFKLSTFNPVATQSHFRGFTQPQILLQNTDLFSINAPLTNGWFTNNNYGNSWQYFELLQYNNYTWNPNQFWRYPANRWAFIDLAYNIPRRNRVVYNTRIRPKVQPVPRIRNPRPRTRVTNLDRDVRRLRTRGINVNVIQNVTEGRRIRNNTPIRTRSIPTRTRIQNIPRPTQTRPVQTRPAKVKPVVNSRRGKSNKKQ